MGAHLNKNLRLTIWDTRISSNVSKLFSAKSDCDIIVYIDTPSPPAHLPFFSIVVA